MTPAEYSLRKKLIDTARDWLGYSEKNGKFKEIIDLYNTQKPLPRGYPVKYTDDWCAVFVTAVGMKAGLHSIVYGECGCGKMIDLYKKVGRWQEDDTYVPNIGDVIMYYWKDGANYATNDAINPPDHVGIVAGVDGDNLQIIEGNKGETVAYRNIKVNGRYIRGYCLPDFASIAVEEEEEMNQEKFNEMFELAMSEFRNSLRDNESGDWSEAAREWAVKAGLFAGNGTTIDGEPNMMWEDFLTREQAAQLFYRFATDHGLA